MQLFEVDPDTRDMLKELEMDRLPNITTSNATLTGITMGTGLGIRFTCCLRHRTEYRSFQLEPFCSIVTAKLLKSCPCASLPN